MKDSDFVELLIKYRKMFGDGYPMAPEDNSPMDYHIARLKKSLETGIPCEEEDIPKGAVH